MKAIGALSISKDKRVTDEMTSDEQESENQTSMEIIESSRQSVGGDALRQLRANMHFSTTFHSTQYSGIAPTPTPAPPTTTTTTTTTPEPVVPPKLTLEEGGLHARNRLLNIKILIIILILLKIFPEKFSGIEVILLPGKIKHYMFLSIKFKYI